MSYNITFYKLSPVGCQERVANLFYVEEMCVKPSRDQTFSR